ncbi:MAG TPA: 4-(cytidine 5'-diphospho)-2-C-methyl-D-erythritol kinase [Bacteroidota bacterium]|nr:4-(cytidine 5'-diphospho)-2-C-methyl-D-erythritol kinase [Bacteroidota bacterium]
MSSVKAYAKINLGLRILGRREDGFHDIETVFHRVNIFDEIAISRAPEISLDSNRPDLPSGDANLCTRAARMLQARYDVNEGAHLQLTKRIPVGAGLGGGSSDAAATLLALNKTWKLDRDVSELEPLALELGSDVAYFLRQGSAHATGRGENLEYFDLDLPYWIVLVYPNIHISTAWAYEHTQISNPKSRIPLKQILLRGLEDANRLKPLLPNDFEPLILRTHPAIARLKKSLFDLGAEFAQLSGSGSSVYGLFSSGESADNATEQLRNDHEVFITAPHFKPGET